MDLNDKDLRLVVRLKKDIETLLVSLVKFRIPVSPQKAMVYLTTLNTLNLTWNVLEKTRIGFAVNDLRKACTNVNVKERARRLLRKWRGLHASMLPEAVNILSPGGEVSKIHRKHGAKRDGRSKSSTPSTCMSVRKINAENASSTTNASSMPESDKIWSVRFSPEKNVGIKLIFVKRK